MKSTISVEELFGAHPEDVISPIKSAAETLSWLEEIFRTIARETLIERSECRINALAEMGAYLASDIGNYVDSEHEKYRDCLQKAGVINSPEVAA